MSAALRAGVLAFAAALPACGPESVGPRSSEAACLRAARALTRLGVPADAAPSSQGGFHVQVAVEDRARAESALTALALPEQPREAPRWLRGPGELAEERVRGRASEAAQALEARDEVLTARIVASSTGASVHVVTLPGRTVTAALPAELASWLAPSLGLPNDAVRVEVSAFVEAPPSAVPARHTGLVVVLAVLVLALSLVLLVVQRRRPVLGAQ